ncbi:MAG: hypothetical protein KKD28_09815, partial [Chloroflexi bacterium]|nr:hypothetical protein [Chloroflexota bacterium]
IVHIPELLGISRLDKQKINQLCNRFSVPPEAMEEIGEEYCYVRKQGGLRGIATTWSPHIYISPRAMDIILYSNEEFVIPSRNIGISAHENPKSALHLKALATYLNSSLVSYWLFFNVPQWGVFHQMSRRIITSTVGAIPVPEFDDAQVQILATHYDKLARVEKAAVNQLSRRIYNRRSRTLFAGDEAKNISIGFSSLSLKEQHQVKNEIRQLQNEWLAELDKIVYDVIGIPDDMRIAIDDFLYVRLPLDDRSTSKNATNAPSKDELKAYAIQLQSELNEFVMGRAIHDINITISNDLVECAIESNPSAEVTLGSINVSESVGLSKMKLMATFSKHLREQVSQWVYIQRGLRVYDNNRIFLYKNPRRIDWTRTQAILDAQDIISHILTTSESTREEHISIA